MASLANPPWRVRGNLIRSDSKSDRLLGICFCCEVFQGAFGGGREGEIRRLPAYAVEAVVAHCVNHRETSFNDIVIPVNARFNGDPCSHIGWTLNGVDRRAGLRRGVGCVRVLGVVEE